MKDFADHSGAEASVTITTRGTLPVDSAFGYTWISQNGTYAIPATILHTITPGFTTTYSGMHITVYNGTVGGNNIIVDSDFPLITCLYDVTVSGLMTVVTTSGTGSGSYTITSS